MHNRGSSYFSYRCKVAITVFALLLRVSFLPLLILRALRLASLSFALSLSQKKEPSGGGPPIKGNFLSPGVALKHKARRPRLQYRSCSRAEWFLIDRPRHWVSGHLRLVILLHWRVYIRYFVFILLLTFGPTLQLAIAGPD